MTSTRRQFVRRTVVAGALAAPVFSILSRRARAADFVLKCGNSFPAGHPINLRLNEAAKSIKEESGGRVDLRVFPNSQLGFDPAMIEQARSGALDICVTSVLFVDSLVPAVNASGLGFAFRNLDEVWAAWDGDFGTSLRKWLREKVGVVVFEKTFDNGFRHITSSVRPIMEPGDLKGMKLRIPPYEVLTSLFTHLGASPVSVAIKETYSALQTHLADGQENPLFHLDIWKFYEVQKYCSLTGHIWDGLWAFANPDNLNRLPEDLRGIVQRNFDEAALKQRADMLRLNESLFGKLEKMGMKINKTDPEQFRQALRSTGFYKERKEKLGPEVWALLERYTGQLG
jgi:tripartite ATP-independent transporter DctP family solute receptor